jgi:hypothetical protein
MKNKWLAIMLGSSIAFEGCYKSHRVTISFIKILICLVFMQYSRRRRLICSRAEGKIKAIVTMGGRDAS